MPPERSRQRWHCLDFWERTAWLLWAVALLIVSARVLLAPGRHSVYPIFTQAAQNWIDGRSLYHTGGDPYRYSPLVAVLFVPFHLLPNGIGEVLWRLINSCLFLSALIWCGRRVFPREPTRAQLAVLMLLSLPLALSALNNGQSNVLVLGLILATLAGVAAERWNLAGACMALATLFKVYPIAVGLLLVLLFPRRFAGRLGMALAVGLVLPFCLQRPQYVAAEYSGWLEHLEDNDRHVMPRELWYRDFRLLCALCWQDIGYRTYQLVQLAAGVGVAGFCLLGRRAGWSLRWQLTMVQGLGCCWMTAFGSATESCTYALMGAAVGWAIVEAWAEVQHTWLRAWLVSSYALFLVPLMVGWFPGDKGFLVQGMEPLGSLLLLAGYVGIGVYQMKRQPSTLLSRGVVPSFKP
jgi:hypothetical protein